MKNIVEEAETELVKQKIANCYLKANSGIMLTKNSKTPAER